MYLHALATALPPAAFTQAEGCNVVQRSEARQRLNRRSVLTLQTILRHDPAHAPFAQLGQQGRHPFLPGARPFAVAETGAVQEIIEGDAMTFEQTDVIPQISFRERCR